MEQYDLTNHRDLRLLLEDYRSTRSLRRAKSLKRIILHLLCGEKPGPSITTTGKHSGKCDPQ